LEGIDLENINLDDINLEDFNLDNANLDVFNLDVSDLSNLDLNTEEKEVELIKEQLNVDNYSDSMIENQDFIESFNKEDSIEIERKIIKTKESKEEIVLEEKSVLNFNKDQKLDRVANEIFNIINNPKVDGVVIVKGMSFGDYFEQNSIFSKLNLDYINSLNKFIKDINNYYEEMEQGIIFSWVFKDNIVIIYGKVGLMIGIVKAKLNSINDVLIKL
ncbi:MAG: hypothetical protein ACP5O4_04175, partial [bacterium]